ncbi:hypothetical protein R3P38DRAFT_2761441 [Favolaschia claudopus]|uniref:Uncharacterized protein n=1 Tax=Favolaschia claudopus TaxID=2862362 RepID=A0AAW0DPQ5_9AGAR
MLSEIDALGNDGEPSTCHLQRSPCARDHHHRAGEMMTEFKRGWERIGLAERGSRFLAVTISCRSLEEGGGECSHGLGIRSMYTPALTEYPPAIPSRAKIQGPQPTTPCWSLTHQRNPGRLLSLQQATADSSASRDKIGIALYFSTSRNHSRFFRHVSIFRGTLAASPLMYYEIHIIFVPKARTDTEEMWMWMPAGRMRVGSRTRTGSIFAGTCERDVDAPILPKWTFLPPGQRERQRQPPEIETTIVDNAANRNPYPPLSAPPVPPAADLDVSCSPPHNVFIFSSCSLSTCSPTMRWQPCYVDITADRNPHPPLGSPSAPPPSTGHDLQPPHDVFIFSSCILSPLQVSTALSCNSPHFPQLARLEKQQAGAPTLRAYGRAYVRVAADEGLRVSDECEKTGVEEMEQRRRISRLVGGDVMRGVCEVGMWARRGRELSGGYAKGKPAKEQQKLYPGCREL